jgi:gamma-glutamyl-gamma-aminobutyraldehyde dehydrogenase
MDISDIETTDLSSLPEGVATQAFINGSLLDAQSGATLETYNPATGTVLRAIADCGDADVDAAVAVARRAFEDGRWSRQSPAARKAALLALSDLVEARAHEFVQIEAVDAGRPVTDVTEGDVPLAVESLRWYAELTDKVFGKVAPTDDDHLGLIVREPAGVVAAVLPWNNPLLIAAGKVGPALAAGNSLIIKPPEQASLSIIRLAQLAVEAGIPPGVFNVLPGRGEVAGRALGLHPDVDVVTFTGSTDVGRAFLRYAADSNMKRVVLECGGKSPQIVLADAARDLAAVAEQLAIAGFANAGQNCTCGSRVIVSRAIKDDLVAAFVQAASTWRVGAPLNPATMVGPIIEASALDRILGHVNQAVDDGAAVAFGGRRLFPETGGWYVEPTILDNVDPRWRVAREEIFGPVISILAVDSDDQAVALANDTPYGLAATVYTHDLDRAHRVARLVRAGVVSVNEYSEGDATTPFGGYKQSGFGGRDHGVEALDQYTETKTIFFGFR